MSLTFPRSFILIALLLAIGAIFMALIINPIYGADFYYVFYPTARNLLEGKAQLYQATGTDGFFNPPQAMFYWLPLALLPMAIANALHMMLTAGFLIAITRVWQRFMSVDFLAIAFALANMHTIDHLIRGQMDVLAVFGLVLAFLGASEKLPYILGLGLSISVIKPTNIILPLLMIVFSLRSWPWRELLKAVVIPMLVLFGTLLAFGFDWPRLFLARNQGFPPLPLANLTLWIAAEEARMPLFVPQLLAILLFLGFLKHLKLSPQNFGIAICINFLLSSYVAGYHYVALVPAMLCIRSRKWLILCWILSFMPFLRAVSPQYAWLSMFYPIAIGAALLWQAAQDEKQKEKPASPIEQAAVA